MLTEGIQSPCPVRKSRATEESIFIRADILPSKLMTWKAKCRVYGYRVLQPFKLLKPALIKFSLLGTKLAEGVLGEAQLLRATFFCP